MSDLPIWIGFNAVLVAGIENFAIIGALPISYGLRKGFDLTLQCSAALILRIDHLPVNRNHGRNCREERKLQRRSSNWFPILLTVHFHQERGIGNGRNAIVGMAGVGSHLVTRYVAELEELPTNGAYCRVIDKLTRRYLA